IAYTDRRAFGCSHFYVRRLCRRSDGSFYTPEADRSFYQAKSAHKYVGVPFQFEGKHSTETTRHLFFRDVMTGVIGETRIIHTCHVLVVGKELGDCHRIRVLLAYTQNDCFQTSFNQPTGMRVERASEMQRAVANLRAKLFRTQYCPTT